MAQPKERSLEGDADPKAEKSMTHPKERSLEGDADPKAGKKFGTSKTTTYEETPPRKQRSAKKSCPSI